MTGRGRPLRFLATTLIGWTALRVALLWPPAPTASSVLRTVVPAFPAAPVAATSRARVAVAAAADGSGHIRIGRHPDGAAALAGRVALALAGLIRFGDPQLASGPPGEMIVPIPSPPPASRNRRAVNRWSADFWLVARDGSGPRAGFGSGELGGGQAGARLAYAFERSRRVAAFARFDAPLAGKGREAAIGFDWRPTAAPVRVVVEERLPLDDGKAAFVAGLVGGFGPIVRRGVRFEGYGQAGIIARRGGEGFADGAIRATRPIGALAGIGFDLGGGVWGGAQRDAARLDVGPTLGATMPVSGRAIRLSLDWRERIAGDARPGSGPAITIAASF